MKTIRTGVLAFLIFSTLIIFSNMGCKKSQEVEQTTELSENQVQTISDTAGVEQEVIEAPSIEKLAKGKVEVETRLESLLSLIEQKEKALVEREKRLMEQEARLEAEAQDLATKKSRFWLQQILSWMALVLGVGGIIMGFIIGRRKQKPPSGKTEVKIKNEADKKKAEITIEAPKAKSVEAKKEKGEEKVKDASNEKETPKAKSEQNAEPRKDNK